MAILRMALRDSESKQKEMRLAMEAQSVRVLEDSPPARKAAEPPSRALAGSPTSPDRRRAGRQPQSRGVAAAHTKSHAWDAADSQPTPEMGPAPDLYRHSPGPPAHPTCTTTPDLLPATRRSPFTSIARPLPVSALARGGDGGADCAPRAAAGERQGSKDSSIRCAFSF